jgi:hypothetical protein
MPERVSRQRRETAMRVAKRLLDPEYRRDLGLGTDRDVPVVVALWNDRLEDVLEQVTEEGGRAVIAVRRPDGALTSLTLEDASAAGAPPPTDPDDALTAAPEATVGMLLDTYGRDRVGPFSFVVADSPLGQFNLVVAAAS